MIGEQRSWVLVAGGFHGRGGMDRCNLALARYLSEHGDRIYLVCHDAEPGLCDEVAAVYIVPKPLGSFMLGEFLLDRRGREVARRVIGQAPGTRVVVNGGNCNWSDVNWVHYVHAAWSWNGPSPAWIKAKGAISRWLFLRREQVALRSARIVIANSERTRRDVIKHMQIEPARVHTVYLGSDPQFEPPTAEARAAARAWLGQRQSRPLVVFVGALGYDSRKGMDTLFSAWRSLCTRPQWDADLVVAGSGRALRFWRQKVSAAGLDGRIKMLGFSDRIAEVLAAADLLVSPIRYEAYGLNVHEAICCGVPAMVSDSAGIAERYPKELRELLIQNPEDLERLIEMMLRWRAAENYWKEKIRPFSQMLRRYTLQTMAAEIVVAAQSDGSRNCKNTVSE
jgi:glycosyltransferase involved in cell wall biosynthesis